MKIRNSGGQNQRIDLNMTPMIDVVFQLLIFFMLTLKIIEPEGDFNINMPIGAPSTANPDEPLLPDIKVRLTAAADGRMNQLQLNSRPLGSGDEAFERLNAEVLHILGNPSDAANEDIEVEIDADYDLDYRDTLKAIAAVRGRMTPRGPVDYVKNIKFAAPRKPAG